MRTRSAHFIGDPFAVLGLKKTSDLDEIRRAFRHRARETHPDHCPGDPLAPKRFARLRAAYEEAQERAKEIDIEDEEHHTRSSLGSDVERGPRSTMRGKRQLAEHELAAKAEESSDTSILLRLYTRYGHRAIIAASLARNPAFPTVMLEELRQQTDNHWTVEAAIAARPDVPPSMLSDIASMARETVIGANIARNEKSTAQTLDALIDGPIRLDPALERCLAGHEQLSTPAAVRLASRNTTDSSVVIRLIGRGDLPEDMVYRLAGQSTRQHVAEAARADLSRRGLPIPPVRPHPRTSKTVSSYWG